MNDVKYICSVNPPKAGTVTHAWVKALVEERCVRRL